MQHAPAVRFSHLAQTALVLLVVLAGVGLAWLFWCWVILFTDYGRPRLRKGSHEHRQSLVAGRPQTGQEGEDAATGT
jgi:hypothetical protein